MFKYVSHFDRLQLVTYNWSHAYTENLGSSGTFTLISPMLPWESASPSDAGGNRKSHHPTHDMLCVLL